MPDCVALPPVRVQHGQHRLRVVVGPSACAVGARPGAALSADESRAAAAAPAAGAGPGEAAELVAALPAPEAAAPADVGGEPARVRHVLLTH